MGSEPSGRQRLGPRRRHPIQAQLEVGKQVLERFRPPAVLVQAVPDRQSPHFIPLDRIGQGEGVVPGLALGKVAAPREFAQLLDAVGVADQALRFKR